MPGKITEAKISQIGRLLATGLTPRQVAAEAGVALSTVQRYQATASAPNGVLERRFAEMADAVDLSDSDQVIELHRIAMALFEEGVLPDYRPSAVIVCDKSWWSDLSYIAACRGDITWERYEYLQETYAVSGEAAVAAVW